MSKIVNEGSDDATIVETIPVREVQEDALEFLRSGLSLPEAAGQPTLPPEVEETAPEEGVEGQQEIPEDEYILEEVEVPEGEEEEYEYEYVEVDPEDLDNGEVEVTSEDEPVIEEKPEFDPNDKNTWAYIGHHSEYKTVDDWKIGTERKDTYIVDLETANDEAREEISQLTQKLSLYTETVSPEMMEVAMVQQFLPEEYRGKTDDDFEDDGELRKFWKAESNARHEYEKKQREAAVKAQAEEEARQTAIKESARFVRETATIGFFGVDNPEERNELRKVLQTKDENGHTPIDHARYIAQVFGQNSGRRYLEGLRHEIQGGRGEGEVKTAETTSHKEVSTPTKPKRKVVQKVKKRKVKVKTQITPPPPGSPNRDPHANKDAKEIMSAGFGTPRTR